MGLQFFLNIFLYKEQCLSVEIHEQNREVVLEPPRKSRESAYHLLKRDGAGGDEKSKAGKVLYQIIFA